MSIPMVNFAGVIVEQKLPCLTRDGVALYADIYRPEAPGDYPVLLMRQAYGRKIASTVSHAHPSWYARQGFMVVIQDVRGRGESEGEFLPYEHEAEDGFDAVEWAASLPHSNGKVGMYGFSYQGSTQWAAASLHPPHLVTIAPSMCAAELYEGSFYPHGTFDLKTNLIWAFQLARDTARRAGDTEAEAYCTQIMLQPDAKLRQLPLAKEDPILSKYLPAYYKWIHNSEYNAYWEECNWLKSFVRHPIPTLQIGGWYDFLLAGTVQSFLALQDQATTEKLFHKLLIGPWSHIPWGRKAGGVDHGPKADGDIHLKQVQWFDYWLKDQRATELYKEPAVTYFEGESMEWRTAERFPAGVEANDLFHLYLSGSLLPANGASGGGMLMMTAKEIQTNAPDVFVYDARLPMVCDSFLPVDRSNLQDRFEILVYSSELLAQELHLLGAPKVKVVYQTLDGPTDLVATLSLLLPDGKTRFLSIGRAEICSERTEGVNEWCSVEISLRPLAVKLKAGTAIRLELTGGAFPLFARHPNGIQAKELIHAGAGDLRIATVAVMSHEGMESFVTLPVIEG